MKKINYTIYDVYFDDKFRWYFYNDVTVYIKIGSMILPIDMKIGALSEDFFEDEEEISEEEYQDACKGYAYDVINEMFDDELVYHIMDRLEDFDIYSTFEKSLFENEYIDLAYIVDEEKMKWISEELDLRA